MIRRLVLLVACLTFATHAQEPDAIRLKPSAEPNNFAQVASHLDAGGEFFLYWSTRQFMGNLRERLDLLANPEGADDMSRRRQLMPLILFGKTATVLLADSGLDAAAGLGVSSLQLDADTSRGRMVLLRHPDGDASKIAWRILGAPNQGLTLAAVLPASTGLGVATRCDVNLFWTFLNQTLEKSNPAIATAMSQEIARVKEREGIDIDALIASLGGEFAAALTLDPAATLNIDGPRGDIAIPMPGFAIAATVNNRAIYDLLVKAMGEGGLKTRTVEHAGASILASSEAADGPPGMDIYLSLAQADGVLYFASHPDQIARMLDTRAGRSPGLLASDEFKGRSRGSEKNANEIFFVSELFSDTLLRFQTELSGMPDSLFVRPPSGVGVIHVREDGYTVTTHADAGASFMLLQGLALPFVAVSGVAVPHRMESRTKAMRVNSAGNLKQIGLACLMYSGDYNGKFPAPDGVGGFNTIVTENYMQAGRVWVHPSQTDRMARTAPMKETNTSYAYVGAGLKDDNADATRMMLAFEKPGIDPGWVNVLFIDGHVEGFPIAATTCEEAVQAIAARLKWKDEVTAMYLEKARKIDAAQAE